MTGSRSMNLEQQLQEILEAPVHEGKLAGAAVMAYRDGLTLYAAAGWRDIETSLPVERDTLFRIASMTKPITSVAALMLVDEGRIALDEPIARVAPEFASMRVLRSPASPLDDTVAATRPIAPDPSHPPIERPSASTSTATSLWTTGSPASPNYR